MVYARGLGLKVIGTQVLVVLLIGRLRADGHYLGEAAVEGALNQAGDD